VSFVRTGLFGEKVVINGGRLRAADHPRRDAGEHERPQLAVTRAKQDALITRDRMRVDIDAEFYVRVRPQREAVAVAAATLGRRTLQPDQLNSLLSGKFISALRSVASEMTMEEMHEQRGVFVQRVKDAAAEALDQNGLQLESVALTDLDQTDLQYFNPSNRFDAEGLTRIIEEIEDRRKLRNDIEQDSMIRIRTRNLEAERQALDIERDSEAARLEQQRAIEIARAVQRAEVARERARRDTEAEQAQINAREDVEKSRISNERAISEARIASERDIRQQEIERTRTVEEAEIAAREVIERARIGNEQVISAARIASEREIRQQEIERGRFLEAAEIAAREATDRARVLQEAAVSAERIAREQETRNLEIERTRALEQEEIAAREAVDSARIAQEERVRAMQIARNRALDEAEIAAREAVERARIAQENAITADRVAVDERRRLLEIGREEAVEAAEIASRETVERRRIAQERAVSGDASSAMRRVRNLEIARKPGHRHGRDQRPRSRRGCPDRAGQGGLAERIAADLATKELEIRRAEELEAAELKATRRGSNVGVSPPSLRLEQERIASTGPANCCRSIRSGVLEMAEEERAITLAGNGVERTEADRSLRQAEIVTRQEVERADVTRERLLEAARLERRRAIEPSRRCPHARRCRKRRSRRAKRWSAPASRRIGARRARVGPPARLAQAGDRAGARRGKRRHGQGDRAFCEVA
jgi:uncharacterized membrane protein YqiK